MKPGGGKAKGSAFERDICRRLSLWVSNGQHVDLFWRSAMSGGRATVQRKKGVSIRQSGDITAVAPEGHALTDRFYIECKSYRALQIDRFIFLGQGTLGRFWKETAKQARQYGRKPMLIFKQNGFPVLVLTKPRALGDYSISHLLTEDYEITSFNEVTSGELPW